MQTPINTHQPSIIGYQIIIIKNNNTKILNVTFYTLIQARYNEEADSLVLLAFGLNNQRKVVSPRRAYYFHLIIRTEDGYFVIVFLSRFGVGKNYRPLVKQSYALE